MIYAETNDHNLAGNSKSNLFFCLLYSNIWLLLVNPWCIPNIIENSQKILDRAPTFVWWKILSSVSTKSYEYRRFDIKIHIVFCNVCLKIWLCMRIRSYLGVLFHQLTESSMTGGRGGGGGGCLCFSRVDWIQRCLHLILENISCSVQLSMKSSMIIHIEMSTFVGFLEYLSGKFSCSVLLTKLLVCWHSFAGKFSWWTEFFKMIPSGMLDAWTKLYQYWKSIYCRKRYIFAIFVKNKEPRKLDGPVLFNDLFIWPSQN